MFFITFLFVDIDAELVINTDNHKRINAGIKRKSSEISSENKRLAEVACVTENAAKINHTKSKDYLPAQGTGAHAILITMLEKSQESGYKGIKNGHILLDYHRLQFYITACNLQFKI